MKLGDLTGLLPEYPRFAPMTRELIDPLRTAVAAFEPHSDWNALSLWCWGETARLSRLGANLILELPAYTGGDPVITILGDDDIAALAITILNTGIHELALIPEPIAQACMHRNDLTVSEDPDNHDYVIDPRGLANGGTKRRREQMRQFQRNDCGSEVRELNLRDTVVAQQVLTTFNLWASIREKSADDVDPERRALTRLLDLAVIGQDQCFATGVFIKGELRAFCITEYHEPPWLTCHFSKADVTVKGLGVYCEATHFTALLDGPSERERARYTRVNIMQDLGIPGLRANKQGNQPIAQLYKYRVQPLNG